MKSVQPTKRLAHSLMRLSALMLSSRRQGQNWRKGQSEWANVFATEMLLAPPSRQLKSVSRRCATSVKQIIAGWARTNLSKRCRSAAGGPRRCHKEFVGAQRSGSTDRVDFKRHKDSRRGDQGKGSRPKEEGG